MTSQGMTMDRWERTSRSTRCVTGQMGVSNAVSAAFQPQSMTRPTAPASVTWNARPDTTSASDWRATASVCRTRVRLPNTPEIRGTIPCHRPSGGASIMARRPLRRPPPPSACANRNLWWSMASTPAATASQSTRFHTSIAGKPMSWVPSSAGVQYRIIARSALIPNGSASADRTGLSMELQ